nr:UDP-glucose 6-dehydrogenase 3 [Tanacetum cinerariifolium]
MFNIVSGKKFTILGFAFEKDMGDTRETPAIDVCNGLIGDKAHLSIYEPQVTVDQIQRDLAMKKFDWDNLNHLQSLSPSSIKHVSIVSDAYEAAKGAHGFCILTEWDEFKKLEYNRIYKNMMKPDFMFDGRNVVKANELREIGFIVYSIYACYRLKYFTSVSRDKWVIDREAEEKDTYVTWGTKVGYHIDEFNKLILDLANINIEIEDEDQAFMLLTSLPLSYENFVETLLNVRKSLTMEDVAT